MKITIDSDVCKKYNLSIPQVLYLILSHDKIHIPTLVSRLPTRLGVYNQFTDWQYYLNDDGTELLRTILTESEPEIKAAGDRYENLAIQLREIFPEGKKDNTYYWRDSVRVIANRLKAFVTKYHIQNTDEEIINATKRYVESFNGDYKFMQLLKYFIMKNKRVRNEDGFEEVQDESQLLSYLDNKNEVNVANTDWMTQLR